VLIDILNAIWGRNMDTWVYVFDEFKPLDIDRGTLFKLAEKDPLKLFELVKKVLLDVKGISNVKVYDIYFDPHNLELLIEYLVTYKLGEVSVKVIHSQDPVATLKKYYEYEKTKK